MTQTSEATHGVTLTDAAATKIKALLAAEARDDLRLRLGVRAGGCSGLVYQLYFDDATAEGDAVRDFDGVSLVVDKMSVPYLDGASVDYHDTIERQGFSIDNPNAKGTCACGESFR
ncbi:MAG: iron-sulfur cluster insertion protein ErpA [Bifidobacteriaceae bacterium]|jgi:iron-sulfur cluster assembly accessory protein|nr:iron-sulfur cluster insertion protein ErpA [Bifidobacteriaceae bacterium]